MLDPKLPLSFLIANRACRLDGRIQAFTLANGHAPDEESTLSEWLKTEPSNSDLCWVAAITHDSALLDAIARAETTQSYPEFILWHVEQVAKHPCTTPDTLEFLSRSPCAYVRKAVGSSMNASREVLNRLAQDPSPEVRLNVNVTLFSSWYRG